MVLLKLLMDCSALEPRGKGRIKWFGDCKSKEMGTPKIRFSFLQIRLIVVCLFPNRQMLHSEIVRIIAKRQLNTEYTKEAFTPDAFPLAIKGPRIARFVREDTNTARFATFFFFL
jgi:hypothetical protein